MGRAVNGMLVFGWNLGSSEEEYEGKWFAPILDEIYETNDYDDVLIKGVALPPDPYDEIKYKPDEWYYEPLRRGEFSRRESPEYTQWREDTKDARMAYMDAKHAARKAQPVSIDTYGSDTVQQYLLLHKEAEWTASWGEVVIPNLRLIQENSERWSRELRAWVRATFDVEPDVSDAPKLLLASYGD